MRYSAFVNCTKGRNFIKILEVSEIQSGLVGNNYSCWSNAGNEAVDICWTIMARKNITILHDSLHSSFMNCVPSF